MIKILANDGIHPDGKLLLEEADYQVDTEKIAQENLLTALQDYDVIIVRSATKVRKELIDACPNLKIIARGGVGMDNIDVEYARSKGIAVINTPAASSQAVAELALGHIFTLARSLQVSNRNMTSATFKNLKSSLSGGIQLQGKTLGIVGFGRIGQAIARMALGMGFRVLPVDPFIAEAEIKIPIFGQKNINFSIRLQTEKLEDVLPKCDFLTVHIPGVDKPVIGKAEIAKMKKTAFIINTARGGAIDEQALLDALNEGRLAGAGLDVFTNEPTPSEALVQHARISVSPHVGAETQEAQINIGTELADQIIAFFGDDK